MRGNSHGIIPTVNIKWDTEGGHLRINECDFDPSIHVLWKPPVGPPPVTPPPSITPPPKVGSLANLPKNWRNEKTGWLREAAEKITGRTPETREQAIQMIEAAL